MTDTFTQKKLKTEKLQRPGDHISRMWKVTIEIVPVIIGVLGTIKNGSDQNLLLLPGH